MALNAPQNPYLRNKKMNPFRWLLPLFLFPSLLLAQGVVISNQSTTPHSSAGLEIDFNDRGLLMPRLTTAQRNSIASPAVGLQIYNSSVHCVQVYFPGGWNNVSCDCTAPPAAPGSITALANICPGDTGLQFSIASVPGATDYTWLVPTGWQITAGQDSLLMTANSDASTGSQVISVTANNGCGSSAPTTFTLNSVFVNPSIVVPNAVYLNSPATFSSQQTGGTYQWSFASGNPSTSSSATPSVAWSQAGTYNVILTRTLNGCSATDTVQVTVINCVYQSGSQTFNATSTGPNGNWQMFVVGVCTTSVTLQARGAEGGGGGGKGARMIGTFSVSGGDTLDILVGQQGLAAPSSVGNGGGGGSFVVSRGTGLLIAAGGGGGSGHNNSFSNASQSHGTTSNTAQAGMFTGGGAAGSSGNGGAIGTCSGSLCSGAWGNAGGGAGYLSSGGSAPRVNGGQAIVSGGVGGNSTGGFGGGGGGDTFIYGCSNGNHGGGGGGGYSGGGGGGSNCNGAGGGGGSYNTGTNQNNSSGFQSGHGQVVVSW